VTTARQRTAGVLLPLFSAPSRHSWGIGEFGDIPALTGWLRRAGFDMLQLLPLNELGRDERSPYSALTAMALDPQYISLRHVPEFVALGGESSLDDEARGALDLARRAGRVDYRNVRAAKYSALRLAFDRFLEEEWSGGTARAGDLCQYVHSESWWLEDYALYRAIRATEQERSWREWPGRLRHADRAAVTAARRVLGREVLFRQYLQWLAEEQWQAARRAAAPVAVFGDFPFLVTRDSADVWARQDEFLLEASVGAPPDEFSDEGQDWGLPPCNWDVMAQGGDDWLRKRIRRMGALFDGYRVDHLVGFYRTYVRPRGAPAYFLPADEPSQLAHGERMMRLFLESGSRITVEDLGSVPPMVRASVARLELAGYCVLRWERDWNSPGLPFRDPARYPHASVATTGTHDMETLAGWWPTLSPDEQVGLIALPVPGLERRWGLDVSAETLTAAVRDHLIELLYGAGSDLLVLPFQDVFGWRDRVNEPGTQSEANWTYRLPWPVEDLESEPESRACADRLRVFAERHGRI